jgi:hypothetical protein
VPGATGARAAAKTHPEVPQEYLSQMANKDKKDDSAAPSNPQSITLNFEMEGTQVNVQGRITKLDRHNLAKQAAAGPADKGDKDLQQQQPKALGVRLDNHQAPESAHPDLSSRYFKDIQQLLLDPLRLARIEARQLVSHSLGERALANAKQVADTLGPGGTWPSIALQTFFNAHDSLISVDAAADSSVAAAGFDDSVVRVWYYPLRPAPASTSTSAAALDAPPAAADAAGAQPAGAPAASQQDEPTLVRSKEPICEDLFGHAGPVYATSISPDNASLLSCSEDGSVRLWMQFPELVPAEGSAAEESADMDVEMQDGDPKKRARSGLPKQQHRRTSISGAERAKKARLKQGSWRNVYAFRSRPAAPVWDVKFAPCGYYFATGGFDAIARVWCVERSEPLRMLKGHLADVSCVAWHPNCQYLATGSADKTVRVWDVTAITNTSGDCVRLLCGHYGGVNAMEFCSSGRYLVSGGQDKLLVVWDFSTGARVAVLEGHTAPVWSISVSPDRAFLASGCADGAVRVWDADRIWGPNSLPHYLAMNAPLHTPPAEQADKDKAAPGEEGVAATKKKNLHIPKALSEPPAMRSFPTKYTPINLVRFQSERLLLAAGSFALPLM